MGIEKLDVFLCLPRERILYREHSGIFVLGADIISVACQKKHELVT